MFKKLIIYVKHKFFNKHNFSLSFNSDIKLKKLPIKPVLDKSKFCIFNKDLNALVFETVEIDKKNRTITLNEICTDNTLTLSFDSFNFLFSEAPTPKECVF